MRKGGQRRGVGGGGRATGGGGRYSFHDETSAVRKESKTQKLGWSLHNIPHTISNYFPSKNVDTI